MEQNLTYSMSQEASKKQNFDNTSTKDTENNPININSSELNSNSSDNTQLHTLDNRSIKYLNQEADKTEIRSLSATPTVVVELSEDEVDKNINNQNCSSDKIKSDQNHNEIFYSTITEHENPMNQFLISNLNQGQAFTEKQNNINDQNFHQIRSVISPEDFHQKTQMPLNENDNLKSTEGINEMTEFISVNTIPELRQNLSDSNLLESNTPSNVTTEENSPLSRPFSPGASTPPASPPAIEKVDKNTTDDNEPQFKTLSINGEDNDNDDEIYNDSDNERESYHEHLPSNSSSSIHFTRPSIMGNMNSFSYQNRFRIQQQNEYTGLQNQGATCYMNSMLQALYHLPIFRRLIYQMDYSEAASDDQNIPLNLQRLFAMMQLRIFPSVNTRELTNSFGWTIQDTYMQHDVQEFCRVILDNLETKMKKQENLKNAIPSLFRGTMKSEIRLKTNDFEKSNTESFYDLSMTVKNTSSLEESFRKYIEPETISDYDTEKNGKQEITKSVEFVQFPPVLYLHLRRFEYDPATQNMKKINSKFEFPETIDLSQFMSEDADQDECQIFDLFGVLVHSGSSYSGHYFAFLRPSGEEDRWFSFNDSTVCEVTKEEAIEANYGGYSDGNTMGFKSEKIYSAYMLIYIRRTCIPDFYEEVSDDEIPASAYEYAQKKKYDYEQKQREQTIRENTLTFELVQDDDIRKNALQMKFSFKFGKDSLVSVKAMKDNAPSVLYDKVEELLNLRRFILYRTGPTGFGNFEEIDRNMSIYLTTLNSQKIYVYSNFKENQPKRINKFQHNQNQTKPVTIINDESENENEYVSNQNEDENKNNIHNEIENTNDTNENENTNINNADENNNENSNTTTTTTLKAINIDEDDENDENEGKEDETNIIDRNANIIINNNNNSNNNQIENVDEDEDENNIANAEEDEADNDEEEEEEEEEEDYEHNYYSNYGYYDRNKTILVFYFIYVKKENKYPIRFWQADRVKSHWKASRIYRKCRRILRVRAACLYEMESPRKCRLIERNSRLDDLDNGAIIVIEIKSHLPSIIMEKDMNIIRRTQNEEEEEEEEENQTINYLLENPPKTFQEFLIYYPNQIDIIVKYENDEHIFKVPHKITNSSFIRFTKRKFKINTPKNALIAFYKKYSRQPLSIVPNNDTIDSALQLYRNSSFKDILLYAYKFPSTMSYNALNDLYRYMYFTGDGYMQYRTPKFAFMSQNATVQDLINHKEYNGQEKVEFRLITINRNKIKIEDNDTQLSNLDGKIRIEKIPKISGDFKIQLLIHKSAAIELTIFKNYKSKLIRKGGPTRIECIYPVFSNELFVDTRRRICKTFYCDEDRLFNISFALEMQHSNNGKYERELADDDIISDLIDADDYDYDDFNILHVKMKTYGDDNNNSNNNYNNNYISQSSTSSHRNRDSINIQN